MKPAPLPGGRVCRRTSCLLALVSFFLGAVSAEAGEFDLYVESGGVWISKNTARIPGDSGTKFDLLDLTGKGPDPYVRFYATYAVNDRHALRLTVAPLEVEGTGRLRESVVFKDDEFLPDLPTTATYRFNTYRLTYRWTFHEDDRWQGGIGAAALVRDAEIALAQEGRKQARDDLGLVPLLHLYGAYRVSDQLALVADVEGAWSPVGRAFDVALTMEYTFLSGWYATAGYRTLEGGADNDDVYTFAWLHYAVFGLGHRF